MSFVIHLPCLFCKNNPDHSSVHWDDVSSVTNAFAPASEWRRSLRGLKPPPCLANVLMSTVLTSLTSLMSNMTTRPKARLLEPTPFSLPPPLLPTSKKSQRFPSPAISPSHFLFLLRSKTKIKSPVFEEPLVVYDVRDKGDALPTSKRFVDACKQVDDVGPSRPDPGRTVKVVE